MLSALQGYGACGRAQVRGIPDMYALEGGVSLKGYGNSVGIQTKDSFDIPKTVAQENIQHRRKRKGVQGKAERRKCEGQRVSETGTWVRKKKQVVAMLLASTCVDLGKYLRENRGSCSVKEDKPK